MYNIIMKVMQKYVARNEIKNIKIFQLLAGFLKYSAGPAPLFLVLATAKCAAFLIFTPSRRFFS